MILNIAAQLHDRMPVILDSAEDAQLWLDTSSQEWSKDVADLLKPFEGELECFIVPKEVGKVGQQSSDFLRVRVTTGSGLGY